MLKEFKSNEFGNVRVVQDGNKVLFVGTDVAKVLGYKIPSKAVNTHCKGVSRMEVPTNGGKQEMLVIPKGDVFRLITKCTLDIADKFESWVYDEVLPTISETGGYVSNDDMFISTYLPHADEQTKMLFKSTLETVRKQNEQLEMMKPKAEYFNALVDRNLLTNFRDTAKELKVGQKGFINFLLDNKYIYRDGHNTIKPYSQYVPSLFELKEWQRGDKSGTQTLITPKGRETFRLLIKEGN